MKLTRLVLLPALLLPVTGVLVNASAQAASVAQPARPLGPLAAQFEELLRRSSNGHSPTPEDIAAITTVQTDAAGLKEALPLIEKALDNSDAPVRTYALTTLTALQIPPAAAPEEPAAAASNPAASAPVPATPTDPNAPAPNVPAPPQAQTVAPPPVGPSTYKPDLQRVLAPAIPKIAAPLTEEVTPNRLLAVTVLGGFIPNPPSAVYPPLLAYLKRDDAISPVGFAVVGDLLQLGPLNSEISDAISRYLRRSDQNADSRSNLIDAIASSPNQSQALNKTMLAYLDSDDPTLRARLILSLPQLDLAPETFSDTRSRIEQLAGNDGENLQVVKAAKAVTSCWTATRMASGCPVYQ